MCHHLQGGLIGAGFGRLAIGLLRWYIDQHSAKGHQALKMPQPKTLGLPNCGLLKTVLRGRIHTSIAVACKLRRSMHVHCHKRPRESA